jgi:hypothetical protein
MSKFMAAGLLAVLLGLTGCVATSPPQPISPTPLPGPLPVTPFDEWPAAGFPADPATIENLNLQDNILTIEVSFSGGCAQHAFEVYAATAFLESIPPQAILLLTHDAQGDTCEALMRETLDFDLTPLEKHRHAFGESPLVLRLHEPQDTSVAEPYQPPPIWE